MPLDERVKIRIEMTQSARVAATLSVGGIRGSDLNDGLVSVED